MIPRAEFNRGLSAIGLNRGSSMRTTSMTRRTVLRLRLRFASYGRIL